MGEILLLVATTLSEPIIILPKMALYSMSSYSPPSSRSRPAERQGSWDRDSGGRRVGGDDGVSFYDDKEMPRSGRHGGTVGGRGALQLKLENLPEDMSWQELKQLGSNI